MADRIMEMAQDLGKLIGQTSEYGAVVRARKQLEEDESIRPLVGAMDQLEQELQSLMQRGEEPGEEFRKKYEDAFSALQGNSTYQAMIAAQSNFDRLLSKVNEAIGQGMEQGAGSRIILPRS